MGGFPSRSMTKDSQCGKILAVDHLTRSADVAHLPGGLVKSFNARARKKPLDSRVADLVRTSPDVIQGIIGAVRRRQYAWRVFYSANSNILAFTNSLGYIICRRVISRYPVIRIAAARDEITAVFQCVRMPFFAR